MSIGNIERYFDIPDAFRVTDHLTNHLSYFDGSVIASQTGTRADLYGNNNVTLMRLFDTRNLLNAVTNVHNPFDPNDQRPHSIFIDNSLDDRLLTSWDAVFNSDGSVASATPNACRVRLYFFTFDYNSFKGKKVKPDMASALAKINDTKTVKDAPSVVRHATDELANSVIGTAVGQKPDLTSLAANFIGDEASDEADVLAHHLSHQSDESADHHGAPLKTPTNYAAHTHAMHVADSFMPDEKPKDRFQQFEDNLLKAQEDEITRSSLSAADAQMHAFDEQLIHIRQYASAPNFFQRAEHRAEYAYGIAKGVVTGSYDILHATTEALDNPVRTGIFMLAAAQQFDEKAMHFINAMVHTQTRPEAELQFKHAANDVTASFEREWRQVTTIDEAGGEALGHLIVGTGAAAFPMLRAARGIRFFETGAKDLKVAGKYSVQYRTARMLEKNVGYNVSPEAWFNKFDNLGVLDAYVTDYRAMGEILGPVRANTQFEVGLFSRGNKLSYFKVRQLENALGLNPRTLTDGFRLSRVPSLFERSIRSPLGGNDFFTEPGAGLPGGGPELTIDPIPTVPWPPRRIEP